MKKVIKVGLMLFLLVNAHVFAQSINIDAKYIYYDSYNRISFLIEKDNCLLLVQCDLSYDDNYSKLTENQLWDTIKYKNKIEFLKEEQISENRLVKIADLKPMKPNQFLKSLKSFQVDCTENENTHWTFNIYDARYTLSSEYRLNKYLKSDVRVNHFITLNNKYSFLLIHNLGLIVPTKNNIIVLFEDWLTLKITTTPTINKKEISKRLRNYTQSKIFKKGIYFGMKSEYGDTLIKPIYDTIYSGSTHTVSIKDKKIKLFFNNGQSFRFKNIRAIKDYAPAAQVIIKNKMYWLKRGSDSLYSKRPLSQSVFCGSSLFPRQTIVNKDGKFYVVSYEYDSEKKDIVYKVGVGDLPIINDIKVKDVKYVDGNKYSNGYKYIFIVEYNDNKSSLLKTSYGNSKETKLIPDDYIFHLDDDIQIFEVRGEYGLFPVHSKARYKNISKFDGNFARFTFPNGKGGWVDKEGKEYLD